jgi:hypothetical protein
VNVVRAVSPWDQQRQDNAQHSEAGQDGEDRTHRQPGSQHQPAPRTFSAGTRTWSKCAEFIDQELSLPMASVTVNPPAAAESSGRRRP